jgi:hypothetical protein
VRTPPRHISWLLTIMSNHKNHSTRFWIVGTLPMIDGDTPSRNVPQKQNEIPMRKNLISQSSLFLNLSITFIQLNAN